MCLASTTCTYIAALTQQYQLQHFQPNNGPQSLHMDSPTKAWSSPCSGVPPWIFRRPSILGWSRPSHRQTIIRIGSCHPQEPFWWHGQTSAIKIPGRWCLVAAHHARASMRVLGQSRSSRVSTRPLSLLNGAREPWQRQKTSLELFMMMDVALNVLLIPNL